MPSNNSIDLSSFKLVEPLDTQEKPVREELSQGRLKSLLHYDPDTGVFTWKVSPSSRVRPGDRAGSKNGRGYIRIMIDTKHYMTHRLAWLYVYGVWPVDKIDHINGDSLDNRICNLREATQAENMQNITVSASNTTGYLGVSPVMSKYRAQIRVNCTALYLGLFDTPEQAHQAYLAAKAKFHKFQPTPRAK